MNLKYEKVTVTIDWREAVSIRNAINKGTDAMKSDPDEQPAKDFYQLLNGFEFQKSPSSR